MAYFFITSKKADSSEWKIYFLLSDVNLFFCFVEFLDTQKQILVVTMQKDKKKIDPKKIFKKMCADFFPWPAMYFLTFRRTYNSDD